MRRYEAATRDDHLDVETFRPVAVAGARDALAVLCRWRDDARGPRAILRGDGQAEGVRR